MIIRHPGKTTYLLGAGFSAAAGIPTMSNFVPTAFTLLKRYEAKTARRRLADDLARLIQSKRAIAANTDINLENIEDLFCLVDRTVSDHPKDHDLLVDVILNTLCLAYLQQEAVLRNPGGGLHLGLARSKPGKSGLNRHEAYEVFGALKAFRDWKASQEARLLRQTQENTVPQRHLFVPEGMTYLGNPCGSTFNYCAYDAFLSYVLDCQSRRPAGAGVPRTSYKADAIITPNYDLVLEQKLKSFDNVKMFYGEKIRWKRPKTESKREPLVVVSWPGKAVKQAHLVLPVIKIHGSINWRTHRGPTKRRTHRGPSQAPVEVWTPLDLLAENLARTRNLLASPSSPLEIPLQPPTWRKEPSRGGLFDTLADEAIRHLRTAERIVVIGYSMPATDFYLRSLMAEGLDTPERPLIEVWNVVERARMEEVMAQMFGKAAVAKIRFEKDGFIGFVKDKVNPESLSGKAARLAVRGEI